MNNETRYTLTKDESPGGTWHIVDSKTGIDYDTCETDLEQAEHVLDQHIIYFVG
jgi:hypothetical protein